MRRANRPSWSKRSQRREIERYLSSQVISKVERPYSPNVLTQKFSMLLARFGYEHLTAHAFRHFFVTSLLRKGVAPHVVQALARHRDARTTLQVYAHADIQDLRAAVNRRIV